MTTLNALIASASTVAGEDLTETITQVVNHAVAAVSITTNGAGTGLELKYSTSGTTSISSITVTSAGSGYKTGDTVTILVAGMLGRSTNAVFTLMADDITTDFTTITAGGIEESLGGVICGARTTLLVRYSSSCATPTTSTSAHAQAPSGLKRASAPTMPSERASTIGSPGDRSGVPRRPCRQTVLSM